MQLFWIDGVLHSAVPHDVPFPLTRTLLPQAVEHPWAALEGRARPADATPDTGPITGTFDRCGRLLLVLGEPGAGKTISLLEIARDLNQRFAADPAQPVAVVFNLSGWATRRLGMADWLLQELAAKYFIPREVARGWFDCARLVVLLDGLDEVREPDRDDCVEAIRDFLLTHAVSGLGITCRVHEYEALPAKLPLTGAVRLQALSERQVAGFLESSGRSTQAVELLLAESDELRTLARSPLMLSVMLSAYEESGAVPAEGPAAGGKEWSGFLFERYVQRMLERKRTSALPFAAARMRYWLAWLADRMERRGQTDFYLEQLQPGWLPSRWQRLLYVAVSRVLAAEVWAASWVLLFLLCTTIATWVSQGSPQPGTLSETIGTTHWKIIGISGVVGLLAALVDGLLLEVPPTRLRALTHGAVARVAIYTLAGAALFAAVETVWLGMGVGLLAGLFFGPRGRGTSYEGDIHTVESLRFSLRDAKAGVWAAFRKWRWGFLLCCVVTLAVQVTSLLSSTRDVLGVIALVLFLFTSYTLPLSLLLGGLFGILSSRRVESKLVPNQGIRLTARNSVLAGAVMGSGCATVIFLAAILSSPFALVGMIVAIAHGDFQDLLSGLYQPLTGGIAFMPVAMLWFGGFDVIKYYTLRAMLYLCGYAPRAYVAFLDAAADVVVLNRVGGGYRFLHRRLQAHLAVRLPASAAGAAEAGPRRLRALSLRFR